jgi:hypothetical protein
VELETCFATQGTEARHEAFFGVGDPGEAVEEIRRNENNVCAVQWITAVNHLVMVGYGQIYEGRELRETMNELRFGDHRVGDIERLEMAMECGTGEHFEEFRV